MLIFGYSFVRRLSTFIRRHWSDGLNHSFSLTEPVVKFCGNRELTVTRALNSRLTCVASFRPNIVIIELGTNDLTRFGPAEVGSNLEEFARNLHANYGVKHRGFWNCANNLYLDTSMPWATTNCIVFLGE